MENRTVIITGGNGFVGRHLIQELQKNGFASRIIVFDTNIDGLAQGVKGYKIDITDVVSATDVIASSQPAWVVHLAAIANVKFASDNPELTRTVNVFGTKQLLDTVLAVSPDTRFLIVSSADIYGHVGKRPLSEMPLADVHPTNPYGQSKYEMEHMIEEKYREHCIRVRPFPHIGPGQKRGFVTADFASQIAAIEAGKQGPVISVGNLTVQRDFTDVRDVVRAYRLLMEQGTLGEVYHVASGVARSIQNVLNALLEMSTVRITVQQDPVRMRLADNPILIGDSTKLYEATSWAPVIPFEQSLHDILNDWRKEYTVRGK